jgi:outer membrane protein TolC
MKTLHYLYALLFLSCCAISTIQAAEITVTLPEAIEMARKNNINLQSSAIDLKGAQRDVDTAWNIFLPSVNATLSNSGSAVVFQDNPIIKAGTNGNNGISAGLSVQFQLNPALKNQLDSHGLNYSIQQVSYQQAISEVERNVTKLFYYLLAEKTNLELQEKNIALAEKQYGKALVNFESGYASEIEVLSAQLSVEQLRPSLQQSENAYEGQLLAFKVLLGLPLEAEVAVEGELPDVELSTSVNDLKKNIETTYSMDLMRLNREAMQNSMALQKKVDLMPSLMLQAQYGLNLWNSSTKDRFNEIFSDSATYTVSVSIPLDGHIPGSRTQVSLAKIEDNLAKLELNRQQTKVQLEQSIITQVNTLQNLKDQMQVAKANLELAQRVYQMYLTQYEAGYTDNLTVEDAQQDVFSVEQQIVYLHYQYASALVDLAYDLQIDIEQL